MSRTVLLIEDERGLVDTLTDRLEAENYRVVAAETGERGLELLGAHDVDVVLLDVMLPGINGFEVCRRIREQHASLPVMMLTARGEVSDKVSGLRLGADDYLTKPFDFAELSARLEALLRRGAPAAKQRGFGDIRVDTDERRVFRGDEPLELAGKEYQLLCYFLEHPHVAHSREALLEEVWKYDTAPPTRTVDVHVAWLRQKVEPVPRVPRHILTVHGVGYKFVP